jgi:hypothetical protein
MGNSTTLAASGNVTLDTNGQAVDLLITTTTGSSGTISTSTGTITVAPTAGRKVTLAQTGSGTSRLNLNGGVLNTPRRDRPIRCRYDPRLESGYHGEPQRWQSAE